MSDEGAQRRAGCGCGTVLVVLSLWFAFWWIAPNTHARFWSALWEISTNARDVLIFYLEAVFGPRENW